MATLQEIEAEIARRKSTPQPAQTQRPQLAAIEAEIAQRHTQPVTLQPAQPQIQQPPEDGDLDQLRQKIIENPAGATLAEFGSAVNRGAVNLIDFFGPKPINALLQQLGVEQRVPEIAETEIGESATTGQFMEPGLARQAVRTAGEFVAPVAVTGQAVRTLAQAIPKVAAPTTTQRVIQAAQAPAGQEATGAILAGAGREVGGEIGEVIGGETGRQVGEVAGMMLAPIGGALAKESGKMLITKGAKKVLSETAPTIEGLKTAARGVFKEIDDLGVTVNPSSVDRLSNQLTSLTREAGFNATIHPKVNAALKEFQTVKGSSQSLSELDILRRVAQSAAKSTEPDEARIGTLMINRIDDFLDNIGSKELSKSTKDVGAKYRDARQLWRRAKKGEVIEDAFNRAQLQATGFENGIRTQFRSILNNKKKSRGFTKEELQAMRQVVEGTSMQNMAKMIGRFGFSEGQASNMLMGSLGVAGGATIGGPAGAVAVPLIGQLSRTLANKLTTKGAMGADLVVKAGSNGLDVVKAYMKAVPIKQRKPQELTELLLRPDISLEGLKMAARTAPKNQKRLISDAVYLVSTIKASQQEQEQQQ